MRGEGVQELAFYAAQRPLKTRALCFHPIINTRRGGGGGGGFFFIAGEYANKKLKTRACHFNRRIESAVK